MSNEPLNSSSLRDLAHTDMSTPSLSELKPSKLSDSRWKELTVSQKVAFGLFGKKLSTEDVLRIYKKESDIEEDSYFNKLQLIATSGKIEDFAEFQNSINALRYRVKLSSDKFADALLNAISRVNRHFGKEEKRRLDENQADFDAGHITENRYNANVELITKLTNESIKDSLDELETIRGERNSEFIRAIKKLGA